MKPSLPQVTAQSKNFFRVSLTASLLAAAALSPLAAVAQEAVSPASPDAPVATTMPAASGSPVFATTPNPAAFTAPPTGTNQGTDSAEPVLFQEGAPQEESFTATSLSLTSLTPKVGEDRNLRGNPGETIQAVLRFRNTSDETISVKNYVEDFIVAEDGSTPIPVTDETSNRWSLASWVTVSPSTATVAPNQTANVNVVINVPDDALPGGHYAVVWHEPNNAAATAEGAQSRVAQRVGSLLYFLVEGPINEEAFVRNFDVQDLTEYGPVPFSYTVENMSDIHISPRASVSIHNLFGQKVDEITIDPLNVFPLMSRAFDGQWDRVWGSGFYTARLTMNYGENGQVVLASDNFWLLPYKLIAATGVTILAVIAILIMVRRHALNQRRQEQETIELLEKRLEEVENGHRQPTSTPENSDDKLRE